MQPARDFVQCQFGFKLMMDDMNDVVGNIFVLGIRAGVHFVCHRINKLIL